MNFTITDIINLVALFIGIIGSYMMFYFIPKIDTQLYIYQKQELEQLRKKDARKNKMIRCGMFLLLIAFVLQAIAIFLNVAIKK